MVGTALSCALANSQMFHDKKVILLEGGRDFGAGKNWNETPFENRVSSITPGSASYLGEIGVWDKVVARRAHPYDKMHVWDGLSPSSIDLNSADIDASEMAHMVENMVLVESCMERARELASVIDIRFNAKVTDIHMPERQGDLVDVQLANGDTIKSKLIVGADGPTSFTRRKADIQTVDYDYNQSAVVATVDVNCNGNTNDTAWQRFLPTGPIALLPLSQNVSNLVWSTTREQARELIKDDEETFVAKVNDALTSSQSGNDPMLDSARSFLNTLTSIMQPGRLASNSIHHPPLTTKVHHKSRGVYRLQQLHAPMYVKSRLALVGDSAHRVHVLAGLGVNLGIGDVKSLVETIETSISEGEDYGCLESLLAYETERQRHTVAVMGVINVLHQLFSTSALPVVLARTLGLQATDSLKPVKQQIIKYAMQ